MKKLGKLQANHQAALEAKVKKQKRFGTFKEWLIESQKPYVSYVDNKACVLNHRGEIDKEFPGHKEGRLAAHHHLKTHWNRLAGKE